MHIRGGWRPGVYRVGPPEDGASDGAAVNLGDNGNDPTDLVHPDSLTGWAKLIGAAAGLISALGVVIAALAGVFGGGGSNPPPTTSSNSTPTTTGAPRVAVTADSLARAVTSVTGYTLKGGPPGNCLYQQVYITPSVYVTHPELHLVGSYRFCIYDPARESAIPNDLANRGFIPAGSTQYFYRRGGGPACVFAWIDNNLWFKWTRPCSDVGLPVPPKVEAMIRQLQQI